MSNPSTKSASRQYKNKPPREPNYICACRQGKWTIVTWDKDDPDNKQFHQFKCRSWRHEGDCRRWKNAQDFARIKSAIDSRDQAHFVYIVLTFNQRKWKDPRPVYKGILQCWDKLRKRTQRRWGPIEYVNVIEQHKTGYPHLNLLVYNQDLAESCQDDGWKRIRRTWLEPNAVESGFGYRTWLEPMRDAGGMAGYFAKIADGNAQSLAQEVSKISQVPLAAPKNFRRLRGSVGFLPCVIKGDRTGELVMIPADKILISEPTPALVERT